jgi:6-pyruvoyltetrahydropterin/6-carboxytetrahydropterin synthase
MNMSQPYAFLTRQTGFSASHRYHNPKWTDERNRAEFGKCNLPNGHGHNYVVEATIAGPIDAETGMVMNLVEIDALLHEVIDPLDHRHLNLDIAYFASRIPTTENIALYIAERIADRLGHGCRLDRLRLYEDTTLWAEVEP